MSEIAKQVSVPEPSTAQTDPLQSDEILNSCEPSEVSLPEDCADSEWPSASEPLADQTGFEYEYEIDADALLADLASLQHPADREKERLAQEAASTRSELAGLRDKVRELENEIKRQQLKIRRQQVEFENARHRHQHRQELVRQQMQGELMRQVLPLMDNFERAMEHATAGEINENFVTGVVLLYKQLSDLLEENQVAPIMSVGQAFNPEFHDAVMVEASSDYETNTVIAEFEKGYTIDRRVLRPARVKVAGRPQHDTEQECPDE